MILKEIYWWPHLHRIDVCPFILVMKDGISGLVRFPDPENECGHANIWTF